MDDEKKAEIAASLDTPLVSLTPRQILGLFMFVEDATDEDLAAVGLPANIRDL